MKVLCFKNRKSARQRVGRQLGLEFPRTRPRARFKRVFFRKTAFFQIQIRVFFVKNGVVGGPGEKKILFGLVGTRLLLLAGGRLWPR